MSFFVLKNIANLTILIIEFSKTFLLKSFIYFPSKGAENESAKWSSKRKRGSQVKVYLC